MLYLTRIVICHYDFAMQSRAWHVVLALISPDPADENHRIKLAGGLLAITTARPEMCLTRSGA